MATTAGRKPKLTCPSPTTTTGARGLPRFHGIGDEEPPYTARDPSFARKLEEAQVVPPFHISYYNVYPKGQQAYSLLLQTTMEPLPHGLWSCSSKPLTGRTGHELRDASATGNTVETPPHTGDINTAWYTGILPRTRTRRTTTCLVGTPSIEATPAGTTTNHGSQPTPRRRLRIAPSHRTGHQDYQPPTLTTDYLARPATNGNSFTSLSHLATNSSLLPLPFMYNPVLSVVRY